MTYKEIQREYRLRNNKNISTCSIADAKRKLGYKVRIAANRKNINFIQKKATDFDVKNVAEILNTKKPAHNNV